MVFPRSIFSTWRACGTGGGSAVTCYRDVTATLITSDQTWVKEEHDLDEVVLGVRLDCGLHENRWHG
jgi:hypothetical protein